MQKQGFLYPPRNPQTLHPDLVPGGAWTVTPSCGHSRASSVIHAPLVLRAMLLVDTLVHHWETSAGAGSPHLPSPLRTQLLLLCSALHAQPASARSPLLPPIALSNSTCLTCGRTDWRRLCSAGSMGDMHSRLQGAEGLFNVFCFQKQGIYILRPWNDFVFPHKIVR